MNILLLDRTDELLADQLRAAGHRVTEVLTGSRSEVLGVLPRFEGVILRSRFDIDAEFLRHAPRLRFVGRLGVGIEHIDTVAAAAHGVAVLNTPEGSMRAVAEHAVGLLLGLLRHIPRAAAEVKTDRWRRRPNWGSEIRGKTVGLLGYGNTGTHTARLLHAFGATVLVHDKYRADYGDAYATAVSVAELQARADVLSLHIFYEPDNHYLINDSFIAGFAKPFWLVNTARGKVVETAALVRGLRDGRIRGAGLDVNEYEEQSFAKFDPTRLPADWQYLKSADNVILTPHIAGLTHESMARHGGVMIEKIAALFGDG